MGKVKKYNLIVVDPPWPMSKKILNRKQKKRHMKIEFDYPVMSLEQIRNLNVENLASTNSWCFLWVIQKFLFESKNILECWGFNYLFMMSWRKLIGPCGSNGIPLRGFRYNNEFIAVGSKGEKPLWPNRKLIPHNFDGILIRHSQKPDEFYKFVEPLGKSRIDVFARKQREGWDVWGNEVECDVSLII